jgi:hypothetical protein
MEVIGWYGLILRWRARSRATAASNADLQNRHVGPRLCPICQARRRAQRHQLRFFFAT